MFVCNGILFNHESPVRGETFVTRKITRGVSAIALGLQDCLYLGNLEARRDWGHARDYVDAMWRILQQDKPEDFVIATGEQHSIREFIELAAKEVDIDVRWQGEGVDEKGYDVTTGKCIIEVDPRYFRPAEVQSLLGDASKAKQKLGWTPKTSFRMLVTEMMREDLASAHRDQLVKKHGFKHYNHNE